MGSLIANKIKTKMCLISFSLYTTITLTRTACSIFCSQQRSSNRNCFVQTQLHTRLTEFLLTAVRFIKPFYNPTRSVKRIFLKQNTRVLAFSRTLQRPLVQFSYLSQAHLICLCSCFDLRNIAANLAPPANYFPSHILSVTLCVRPSFSIVCRIQYRLTIYLFCTIHPS